MKVGAMLLEKTQEGLVAKKIRKCRVMGIRLKAKLVTEWDNN